jgi:uncharacterized protein YdhG (YjbR/CyaY superfamily)
MSSQPPKRSSAARSSSTPAGPSPGDVDGYLAAAPAAAQPLLRELRRIVLDAAPEAVETLKYGMPCYEHRGRRLVCFAANKRDVAVYGLVHEDGDVPAELASHLEHRSTLKFPLGGPLPAAALGDALRRKLGAAASG